MLRNHEIFKSVADEIPEDDYFRACSQKDGSLNNSTSVVKTENVDRETPSPKLCSFIKRQENANVLFNWNRSQNNFNSSTSSQDLANVFNKFILNMPPSAEQVEEISDTEKSFLTPQLYHPKSASTPVQKSAKNTITLQRHVSIQTDKDVTPNVRKFKNKQKHLHSRSFPGRLFLETAIPDNNVKNIKIYTEIVTRDDNYQWSSLLWLSERIHDVYSWFKVTIIGAVNLIYEFTSEDRRNSSNVNENLNNLHKEILSLKEEQQHFRRELYQLKDIRKELHEIKNLISQAPTLTPPPPPPPLPPPLPPLATSNTTNKIGNPPKKKVAINQNARPVISLDDILNVKLRKAKDRPAPVRRLTEPLMSLSLKKMKVKPTSVSRSHASTPTSNATNLSSSPISTFTRMLTADSNVRRVKRLQRQGAHSFDNCSRRTTSRRERES